MTTNSDARKKRTCWELAKHRQAQARRRKRRSETVDLLTSVEAQLALAVLLTLADSMSAALARRRAPVMASGVVPEPAARLAAAPVTAERMMALHEQMEAAGEALACKPAEVDAEVPAGLLGTGAMVEARREIKRCERVWAPRSQAAAARAYVRWRLDGGVPEMGVGGRRGERIRKTDEPPSRCYSLGPVVIAGLNSLAVDEAAEIADMAPQRIAERHLEDIFARGRYGLAADSSAARPAPMPRGAAPAAEAEVVSDDREAEPEAAGLRR